MTGEAGLTPQSGHIGGVVVADIGLDDNRREPLKRPRLAEIGPAAFRRQASNSDVRTTNFNVLFRLKSDIGKRGTRL